MSLIVKSVNKSSVSYDANGFQTNGLLGPKIQGNYHHAPGGRPLFYVDGDTLQRVNFGNPKTRSFGTTTTLTH